MQKEVIIAVDFDGTLVKDRFPDIGEEQPALEFVKMWREQGAKVILWTCRHGKHLDNAVEWCKENGLEFDAINENLPEIQEQYGHDTRKVFADYYLDDKAEQPFNLIDLLFGRIANAVGEINTESDN